MDCRVGTIFPPRNDMPVILSDSEGSQTPHPVFRFSAKAQNRKQTSPSRGEVKKVAFTLAEVLITLGIIGIVAAMTMPSVIAKHQKQVTVSRLKKAYTTLSQMVEKTQANDDPALYFLTGNYLNKNTSKQFFETYWLPYFNNPLVAADSRTPYSSTKPYSRLNGNPYTFSVHTQNVSGRMLFVTQDGTIYLVDLLSKWSSGSDETLGIFRTIVDVYCDINGKKPPNTFGKDVFIFKVDYNRNVVQPGCNNWSITSINNDCKKGGDGMCCAKKIMQDGWQIKDDYPW